MYGTDEKQPWSIYWFHVKGGLIPAFLRELDITVESPVVAVGDDPQVLALFEELLDVVAHGYNTLQLLHASQILAHLMAVMICDHRNTPQEQPGTQQRMSEVAKGGRAEANAWFRN